MKSTPKPRSLIPSHRIIAENIKIKDANLIAAAPDMYAALKHVKKWMQHCLINAQQKGIPSRNAYDMVADAINKAEGKKIKKNNS